MNKSDFSLRIHSGRLKNRVLREIPAAKGHLSFTPQILKEALFSMLRVRFALDSQTTTVPFIDVFAGSGQMALEAWSAGFDRVIAGEIDPARVAFIRKTASAWGIPASGFDVTPLDFERLLAGLDRRQPMVIFVDPPYIRRRGEYIVEIIMRDLLAGGLAAGSIVFCQLLREFCRDNPLAFMGLPGVNARKYGSQNLYIYDTAG